MNGSGVPDGQVKDGSGRLGERALDGIVRGLAAVDLRDHIALRQAGPGCGTARDHCLDFQIIGFEVQQQPSAIEDVGFAIIRVLLEIHLSVGVIEGYGELLKDMQTDVAGNGAGGKPALAVYRKNSNRPAYAHLAQSQ